MGSQSVTNFSALRMKRIASLVKDYYSPQSPRSDAQAKAIGAAAVGTLAATTGKDVVRSKGAQKGGGGGQGGGAVGVGIGETSNEFLQALASHRVENAINLIKTLAKELKEAENPETVYEKYGIAERAPLEAVSRLLTTALSEHLGSQAETDLGFAARDAILRTIIDIVSVAFPHGPEPAKVDRRKFAQAFKKLSQEQIGTVFLQNAASALVNLVLDATRGPISRSRMAEIEQRVRESFIPEFIEELKRAK